MGCAESFDFQRIGCGHVLIVCGLGFRLSCPVVARSAAGMALLEFVGRFAYPFNRGSGSSTGRPKEGG
jgi:hypothetical protein